MEIIFLDLTIKYQNIIINDFNNFLDTKYRQVRFLIYFRN